MTKGLVRYLVSLKNARAVCIMLISFGCSFNHVLAQNQLTVTVYDVRVHKNVPGVTVQIFALSAHNGQLGSMPGDPYGYSVVVTAVTNSEGRATFETEELFQAVESVNRQLRNSPRKLITKHYEVGIFVLSRGKHCSFANQSFHQIMRTGIVGEITDPPCKTNIKQENFHATPGETIMFVTHAM